MSAFEHDAEDKASKQPSGNASPKPSIGPSAEKRPIPKAVTVQIGVNRRTGESDGDTAFVPLAVGQLMVAEGSPDAAFSGMVLETTRPFTVHLSGITPRFLSFAGAVPKPRGRPRTALMRDIAVLLAYKRFEFFYPDKSVSQLRRLIVQAWQGLLPQGGFKVAYAGISENKHVARSMANALRHAPQLGSPIRTMRNVHTFGENTLAGALISHVGSDTSKEMLFVPDLTGRVGWPVSRRIPNGDWCEALQFHDVEAWAWRIGAEHAESLLVSTWRPAIGGSIVVLPHDSTL